MTVVRSKNVYFSNTLWACRTPVTCCPDDVAVFIFYYYLIFTVCFNSFWTFKSLSYDVDILPLLKASDYNHIALLFYTYIIIFHMVLLFCNKSTQLKHFNFNSSNFYAFKTIWSLFVFLFEWWSCWLWLCLSLDLTFFSALWCLHILFIIRVSSLNLVTLKQKIFRNN